MVMDGIGLDGDVVIEDGLGFDDEVVGDIFCFILEKSVLVEKIFDKGVGKGGGFFFLRIKSLG